MSRAFSVFTDLEPIGFYCVLCPMEYENTENDPWIKDKKVFVPKESTELAFWHRLLKMGHMVKGRMPDLEIGDIVRLPGVYTRERFWTPSNQMLILTKCSNIIARIEGDAKSLRRHE